MGMHCKGAIYFQEEFTYLLKYFQIINSNFALLNNNVMTEVDHILKFLQNKHTITSVLHIYINTNLCA